MRGMKKETARWSWEGEKENEGMIISIVNPVPIASS